MVIGQGVKLGDPTPAGTSPVLGTDCPDKGAGIVKVMKATADAKKIDFYMETSATKLLTNGRAPLPASPPRARMARRSTSMRSPLYSPLAGSTATRISWRSTLRTTQA